MNECGWGLDANMMIPAKTQKMAIPCTNTEHFPCSAISRKRLSGRVACHHIDSMSRAYDGGKAHQIVNQRCNLFRGKPKLPIS